MTQAKTNKQPNILFFLIDDMGWRDLTCYGSSFYETPHIDRLAKEGMLFTDAYASCPVCSPTRASVMTGQYPATVGITNYIPGNAPGKLLGVPYFDRLPASKVTSAMALKAGGYQTWHVGKWHLGKEEPHWPTNFGFEKCVGLAGGTRSYFSPFNGPQLSEGPVGEYLTDRLTTEAITLLHQRDTTRPFFMNFWHFAVHTPIQAPSDLIAKYQRKAADLGLDKVDTFEEGEAFPCLHKKDKRVLRRLVQSDPVYAAMIENLDTNIGRMLDALDELGLAEDTIVVFTSDNGGLSTAEGSPTCNAPLSQGKGWMYDGGVREPLLVRWPAKIQAQSTCDVPVTSTDFFPTLLDAADLALMPEAHCDGVSILPLLQGEKALDREAIFWHYPHYSNQGGSPASAVRMGDWKLIEFYDNSKLELYNLRNDIEEDHDLAAAEPDRVEAMHKVLVDWRLSVEAKIPPVNPDYQAMLAGTTPVTHMPLIIPGDDHGPQP